jgi:hypothetical protein
VVWGQLCGSLCFLVHSVVQESKGELSDHGEYDEETEDLMSGIPALGLWIVLVNE